MVDVVYPVTFPKPLLTPYRWLVNVGLVRTPMEGGFSRQRRLFDVMPHTFQLEFCVMFDQLFNWQTWVNTNAYNYFQLELASFKSSEQGRVCYPHLARFTSDLDMELIEGKMVRVIVSADVSPQILSNFTPAPTADWIIAGTPPAPNSANTYIAGTPPSPSNANLVRPQ